MAKRKRSPKDRCIICLQVVDQQERNTDQEFLSILKQLLPCEEFSNITDPQVFPQPNVCQSCLKKTTQISRRRIAIERLSGKSLNVQLYKPRRSVWTSGDNPSGSLQTCSIDVSTIVSDESKCGETIDKIGRETEELVSNQDDSNRNESFSYHDVEDSCSDSVDCIGLNTESPKGTSRACEKIPKINKYFETGGCECDKSLSRLTSVSNTKRINEISMAGETSTSPQNMSSTNSKGSSRQQCFNNTKSNSKGDKPRKKSNRAHIIDQREMRNVSNLTCRSLDSYKQDKHVHATRNRLNTGRHSINVLNRTTEKSKVKSDYEKDISKHTDHKIKRSKKNSTQLPPKEPNRINKDTGGKQENLMERKGKSTDIYKCHYADCHEEFTKKEKYEIHKSLHNPEDRLFCEKCGRTFSCRRYLTVHIKVHNKREAAAVKPPPRCVSCDHDGCFKMFTSRVNMRNHYLNQHKGRLPRSVPGVSYPCTYPGCNQQFSFRSTLYRHKKLVHKGGNYKQGNHEVLYTCTHNKSCGKVFNRKNLLEEHLVMEHGQTKSGRRLRPLRSKENDFSERVCHYCGMVLTEALHERHVKLYHHQECDMSSLSENASCPCLFEGCEEVFNTPADCEIHVKEHIASPPYACNVADCTSSFYLEKNLDHHLWRQHTKKESICDYLGCHLVFPDQIQLAKHSKKHYNGKMRCPWPQCDSMLTVSGQLVPHFIAHSRALRSVPGSHFVCEICQMACSSRWGLMIHKRKHGDKAAAHDKPAMPGLTKFYCEEPICHATFCDQKGFFDHFLYHHTQRACACSVEGCGQLFDNLVSLARHTGSHLKDNKFLCPWDGCKKIFSSLFVVKRHIYRHITSESCNKSKQKASTTSKMWPLSCPNCFMVFKMQENFDSHLEYHKHDKTEYVCPTCGKKGRHSHIKVIPPALKNNKTFPCNKCDLIFATITSLRSHQLHKHQVGQWPCVCSYCGKGFVSKRELERHLPTHKKEKPFVCGICDARFASHTGHRAHMRKHTGQRFVCEVEGCGKVYTTPVSLKGHLAQHAGFSKICEHCGKTFKNPYSHKCKAGRDNKRRVNPGHQPESNIQDRRDTQQGQSVEPKFLVLQPPVHYSFPPEQQQLSQHSHMTSNPQPEMFQHHHQQPIDHVNQRNIVTHCDSTTFTDSIIARDVASQPPMSLSSFSLQPSQQLKLMTPHIFQGPTNSYTNPCPMTLLDRSIPPHHQYPQLQHAHHPQLPPPPLPLPPSSLSALPTYSHPSLQGYRLHVDQDHHQVQQSYHHPSQNHTLIQTGPDYTESMIQQQGNYLVTPWDSSQQG